MHVRACICLPNIKMNSLICDPSMSAFNKKHKETDQTVCEGIGNFEQSGSNRVTTERSVEKEDMVESEIISRYYDLEHKMPDSDFDMDSDSDYDEEDFIDQELLNESIIPKTEEMVEEECIKTEPTILIPEKNHTKVHKPKRVRCRAKIVTGPILCDVCSLEFKSFRSLANHRQFI